MLTFLDHSPRIISLSSQPDHSSPSELSQTMLPADKALGRHQESEISRAWVVQLQTEKKAGGGWRQGCRLADTPHLFLCPARSLTLGGWTWTGSCLYSLEECWPSWESGCYLVLPMASLLEGATAVDRETSPGMGPLRVSSFLFPRSP